MILSVVCPHLSVSRSYIQNAKHETPNLPSSRLGFLRATYLPKLLTCILAGHALEDLCAAGVLVNEGCHVVDCVVDAEEDGVVCFGGLGEV